MAHRFTPVSGPLTIEAVEDGELIYDARDHAAHHLDAVAARVRQACTADSTVASIARACDLTETETEGVLTRLAALGLVEIEGAGVDRRQMLRRSAAVAAGAGAVMTVLAPAASAQASPICVNPGGAPAGVCVLASAGTAACCSNRRTPASDTSCGDGQRRCL